MNKYLFFPELKCWDSFFVGKSVSFFSPWFRSMTCPFWDAHTKYTFNLTICPGVHFLLFSFSSRAVSNSGLIPSTWLSAFFYSWFLFFSSFFPVSLVFHFLSFSARTAFYLNHLRERSGHNELGILSGLCEGVRCGRNGCWAALERSSKPVPAQGTGSCLAVPSSHRLGISGFLQLLLVHGASMGLSHNLPAVWLGNICGSRNITAAEICAPPSFLIKIADETFICQGWMFS